MATLEVKIETLETQAQERMGWIPADVGKAERAELEAVRAEHRACRSSHRSKKAREIGHELAATHLGTDPLAKLAGHVLGELFAGAVDELEAAAREEGRAVVRRVTRR